MSENHSFGTLNWKQLTLPEPDDGPPQLKGGDSLNELINEFKNKPAEITPPTSAPEPMPTPGAETPGKTPGNGPNLSDKPAGRSVVASEDKITSARLIMRGWDTAFAMGAVAINKRHDKYEYYKATERDFEELTNGLAEILHAKNIDVDPWIPFVFGFTGIYGAKTFTAFQDKNAGQVTAEQLEKEREILRLQAELKEIREKINAPGITPKKSHTKKPSVPGRGPGRPRKTT